MGRKPLYPQRGDDGAPKLTIRLHPDLMERVKTLGGATWVRELIQRELDWDLALTDSRRNWPHD